MSFREEIVCIHLCCEHCCERTSCFVRLDSCCENYHISVDMELFIGKQIGCLNVKFSVRLRNYLADHSLNIVNIVLLNGSSVEFIEILSGSTNVYIENINLCIRIFLTDEHCVLCRIHTADLRAVGLTLAVVAS